MLVMVQKEKKLGSSVANFSVSSESAGNETKTEKSKQQTSGHSPPPPPSFGFFSIY